MPGLEVAGTAADGESALGAIETLRPDLILLDVEMPVMDGLVTLRQVARAGTQDAGDHVQFADAARRQGDDRGAGQRRFGLCGQAGGAGGPRGGHPRAGAGSDSQDSCADQPALHGLQPQPVSRTPPRSVSGLPPFR